MTSERRVVVIGSGPAGASAARELVRCGIPVTLLEAGDCLPPGGLLRLGGKNLYRKMPPLEPDREHTVSGDPQTLWLASTTLGGLSNSWTGAVPRFAPDDFTEGERLHERYRWPVAYDDLVPYYEQAERTLRITGAADDAPGLPAGKVAYPCALPADWGAVARRANRCGQGFAPMPLADGPPTLAVRRGTAFNSFVNLVRPLLSSPLFALRSGADALHLRVSASGTVDGVVYRNRATGETECIAADAVVVACGALRSAKLLLQSVSPSFPDGLGNTEGVLGRYLHDHPREWWTFDLETPLSLLETAAYLTRLPPASSPPLLATSWTMGTAGIKDRIRSRFGLKGHRLGIQVFGTMVPSETCRVRLSADRKDEFGVPALDICIRYSEDEMENMVRARAHLAALMDEAGCPGVMGWIDPTLYPGTSAHYGGTTRMHANPRYGVVDGWNRVHDAPNVLVCDAGCFTTAVEKNPTLTVMALAARAAAHLADALKHDRVHEGRSVPVWGSPHALRSPHPPAPSPADGRRGV